MNYLSLYYYPNSMKMSKFNSKGGDTMNEGQTHSFDEDDDDDDDTNDKHSDLNN